MSDSQTKNCPFCSEEIKYTAIKCRYCGSMLSDTPSSSGSITGIQLVNQVLCESYEILEEIGRGGMATVYKAIQKNLNRPVALKVVHQNLLHDSDFVARFHREAQICASLSHPNIVTIYDEGRVANVHFMAMEYLEGTDLRNILKRKGRLGAKQTIEYLSAVAGALDYAHGRGLIHRDIKSANIFITGSGRVVLTDFGIAHAAAGIRITIEGTVIGTPEYMSPEQADGKKVDHRTDLFSFGVVMYECLTGSVPLQGESTASTIYKVIHEQPDSYALHGIPVSLRELTMDLLNKDPDQRPNNAKQVEKILNLIQRGKTWQPSVTHKQRGPKRKIPAIVYLLAFIGIVLLGILVPLLKDQQINMQKQVSVSETELPQQIVLDYLDQAEAEQKRLRQEQEKEDQLAEQGERQRQEAEQEHLKVEKEREDKQAEQREKERQEAEQERLRMEQEKQHQLAEQRERERQEAERLSTQREQQAWQAAQSAGTKSAYERYLRNFPSGRYAGQAKESIRKLQSGTFKDPRDGQLYKWVMIGNQVWMAENLNYLTRSDSWCYDNRPVNCDNYGRLYNWSAAMNACPPGWHLPSNDEWRQLETYIGSTPGTKLKTKSGWADEGNGTDDYGFSALPGGRRNSNGSYGSIDSDGFWWSSTEGSSTSTWYRGMSSSYGFVYRGGYNKELGFSVRCVRVN